MARPQAFVLNRGGTVAEYMPIAPGANPRVAITSGAGSTIVAARLPDVVDAVATTLSGVAAMGATSINVASVAGIVAGRRYRLGPATEYHEFVKVRFVTPSTITLTLSRPLSNPYPSGSALVGTFLSVTVTAAEASSLFWDGTALWTWDSMMITPIETSVECVRSAIRRLCTKEDVAARYPQIDRLLSDNCDVAEWLDAAFDTAMLALGAKFRVHTLRGSTALVDPTAYQALVMAFNAAEASTEAVARWQAAYERAIEQTITVFAADDDQDGVVESHEGRHNSIRLLRAS